jgi:hypothetical protein
MDITRKLEMMDRVFPKFDNSINLAEGSVTLGDSITDAKNTETQNNENVAPSNVPDLPTTGDDDLDFLLYQKNIYQ